MERVTELGLSIASPGRRSSDRVTVWFGDRYRLRPPRLARSIESEVTGMRICYVTSRSRPHTGGVETHVTELATRFADRGHEVTVVAADRGTVVGGHRLPARERTNDVPTTAVTERFLREL